VIATGESHSVKEFLEEVLAYLDLDWRDYVDIDPRYFRPTEVECLLGDASKARQRLGWQPQVTFRELARLMVDADLQALLEMRQCQDIIRQMAKDTASGNSWRNSQNFSDSHTSAPDTPKTVKSRRGM